jgi:hypothetical protein
MITAKYREELIMKDKYIHIYVFDTYRVDGRDCSGLQPITTLTEFDKWQKKQRELAVAILEPQMPECWWCGGSTSVQDSGDDHIYWVMCLAERCVANGPIAATKAEAIRKYLAIRKEDDV